MLGAPMSNSPHDLLFKATFSRVEHLEGELRAILPPGLFARLALFVRQVVAELKKVVRPTRSELITYTSVVIVFVAFIVALVAGLDLLFAKGVIAVFG